MAYEWPPSRSAPRSPSSPKNNTKNVKILKEMIKRVEKIISSTRTKTKQRLRTLEAMKLFYPRRNNR